MAFGGVEGLFLDDSVGIPFDKGVSVSQSHIGILLRDGREIVLSHPFKRYEVPARAQVYLFPHKPKGVKKCVPVSEFPETAPCQTIWDATIRRYRGNIGRIKLGKRLD